MKRTVLLVLLALGVGFAVGAGRGGKKFRYLSDRWNAPADITEIELACLRSEFQAAKPIVLRKEQLVATEVRASARSTHIHLTVQVQSLGDEGTSPAVGDLERACAAAYTHWQSNLFRRSLPGTASCPVTIDLVRGLKTIYRQIRDGKGVRGYADPPV